MGLGGIPMYWDEEWTLEPTLEGDDASKSEAGVVLFAVIANTTTSACVTPHHLVADVAPISTTCEPAGAVLTASIDLTANGDLMAHRFGIKRGDTLPRMPATLKKNGVPIDLTTATKVTFFFRLSTTPGVAKYRICQILDIGTDETQGKVEVPWDATDTDTVGTYVGEFEILFDGGGRMTVPNDPYEPYTEFDVLADLGTSAL